VNDFRYATSGHVHSARTNVASKIGAIPIAAAKQTGENTMLRNFAAALLATTLIAGPAFAAQSSDTAGATHAAPAASVTAAKTSETAKPVKVVKHVTKHTRKHVAHRTVGTMHQARQIKPAKTHQASIAKPVKTGDKAAM
jgi:hypothetical protein